MKLPIVISRLSNLSFFIQKIHRKKYNSGEFNLQEYLSDREIGFLFYGKDEDEIWNKVNKYKTKKDLSKIKESVADFEAGFSIYWNTKSKNLLSWERYFQNNRKVFWEIINNIQKITNVKDFPFSETSIYLVSDPTSNAECINAWVSCTPTENFVVVEIPSTLKTPNDLFPIGILSHEFLHVILRRNKKIMIQIQEIAEKNAELFKAIPERYLSTKMIFEELLVSSFLPEGYLREIHLNMKISNYDLSAINDFIEWRRAIAANSRSIAKEYTENELQIDEKYLITILSFVKKNTS